MLDYPQVAAVAAVLREGSFERAAEALHLTASLPALRPPARSLSPPTTAERQTTMDLKTEQLDGGIGVVRLAGRMDGPGADAIGLRFSAATAANGQPAVVDLSDVEFIASMGLRLLISTARALGTKGWRMAIFGAQPMVQAVFDDAALDQLMPICSTQDEAVAAVSH